MVARVYVISNGETKTVLAYAHLRVGYSKTQKIFIYLDNVELGTK